MYLSSEKKQKAYNAIADAVMDARVHLRMAGEANDNVDFAIAQITERAWSKLKTALNIIERVSP